MFLDKYKKIIEDIQKSNEDLMEKVKLLEERNESQQEMLSNIFLYHKLEPTPFFRSFKELSYELLLFVDNVCKKYDLNWWMDYGTLLGAVRHNDFIPWDDDLDIGMMRDDYNKFVDIIDKEIKENNLKYLKSNFKIQHPDTKPQFRWLQIKYLYPGYGKSLTAVDIFAYDYLKDYPRDDVSEKFHKSRRKFYRQGRKKVDIDIMLKDYYNDVGLSLEKQDYYISGAECPRGNTNRFKFQILETDNLFPLQKVPFGCYDFPAPNNDATYLKQLYGKTYLEIPDDVRSHGRLIKVKKYDNVLKLFEEGIEMFKIANNSF